MKLKFLRNELTHHRFEPEVDGGTTYAFEYKKGKLIIGREKMYRLISALSREEREFASISKEFIDRSCKNNNYAYCDEKELLIDLVKLVQADVIRVV